jgi:hypothetical protein
LNNTDVYANVDSFIIEQLKRDPRVLKNDISVPEQFRTFIEWQAENKFALQATEWIQSIIGNKGLSSATRYDDQVFHSVRAF